MDTGVRSNAEAMPNPSANARVVANSRFSLARSASFILMIF